MNISGLLNIQSTTVFFPKDKAERMKHRDEQDGNAAENVGSLLQPHVFPGVAWEASRLGAMPKIPERALPPLQRDRPRAQQVFSICNFSLLTFMCTDSKAM